MEKQQNPTQYSLTSHITKRLGESVLGLTFHAYDQDPRSPDDFLSEVMTNGRLSHHPLYGRAVQVRRQGKQRYNV